MSVELDINKLPDLIKEVLKDVQFTNEEYWVSVNDLKVDEELESYLPKLTDEEMNILTASIETIKQPYPIIVDKDGVIIDGHHRYLVYKKLGKERVDHIIRVNFRVKENKEKAILLSAVFNLGRRHLDAETLRKKLVETVRRAKELISKKEDNYNQAWLKNSQQNDINTKEKSAMEIAREAKELAKSLGVSKGVSERSLEKEALVQETIDQEFPWIKQLYKNNVVSTNALYELFTKAKDKLQKIANLPPTERNQLLTTKEGRKIILERDDLLQPILEHKMAVSQAINKIKTEEKLQRSKKKSRVKDEDLDETEDEGEEVETDEEEEAESDEYDFVGEWQRAKEEEETEQKLTGEFNEKDEEAPPTRTEIYTPKADLDSLYKAMPSIKKLVNEGKLTEKDAEKVYEIWRNMEAIYKQASLLWYNTIDILLKRAGLSEKEREEIFYEMVKPYFRLFSREEVFPKEVLEGKL
ncbi:ParB N-terminal domain-containing protein [Sulfolobus acidocaldarius]|uniref:ParB N-terminal domain-containing protein n=1 Tax=Sulfolobus acidocaldarius TaxID=2285 RepID=UPI000B5A6C58|nr:ParB N-terminal domain-containing protein [Sulfolobus acidocaldarius]